MENKADIDGRFRFPFFEMCNFYAAKSIVEKLKGILIIFMNFYISNAFIILMDYFRLFCNWNFSR